MRELKADDGGGPGEAGSEGDHQHRRAFANPSGLEGFVQ
jgi:hypothetical protein